MSFANLNDNYSAMVQAEMAKSVIQTKQQNCPTHGSLKSGSGARGKSGALPGLEIPFWNGVPHGEVALDPVGGGTSFDYFVPPGGDKMYVGLAFMGFTVEWEHFHENDASSGILPKTRFEQRDDAMKTYYQHQNWYSIGQGDGALAVVAAGGGGGSGTITFANDNTARGRSKGSLRLAVSPGTTAGKRILYESYTKSTDTKTATFYITSKASSTTAVIVVTDAGTVVAGDIIVKAGHYKKVPYGFGYHISEVARQYQGANTTTYPFLNSRKVAGGSAPVNATLLDTAKGALQTRANNANARFNRVCHLTIGNYKTLAGYGYTLRAYNAERGEADTTFGLPFVFRDEDTIYVQDADMEDAYIYMRDKKSYFYYTQQEMERINPQAAGQQWVGTNQRGSTEFFENYGEATNLAWDARGDDGKGKKNGSANSSVVIDALQIPAISQMSEAQSLV